MNENTKRLLELGDRHNSTTYRPARMILESGEGVYVKDTEGNSYLDFVAGIAVSALGHNHPKLTAALREQAGKLLHVSNMFFTAPQISLMEKLTAHSFADRVFLCNSGTEANEAALKLAHRYQRVVAGKPDKFEIVSMNKSFHGRSMASLTATGQPKYHKGFEPMIEGYKYADFNDLESVRAMMNDATAAVIVEPMQGEGGIRPAEPAFLKGLRALCDEFGALLIFDEVQTGVGRTGKLWAYEHYGITPDIMTLAKGLGGGFPIGAMLATEKVYSGFEPGSHASTFGGNPMACRAALVVLEHASDSGFLENVNARGEQLRAGLGELSSRFEALEEVRGLGLMVGAQCAGSAAAEIALECRSQGLLINTAGGNTLRLVPPLIVTESDVSEALSRLGNSINKWQATNAG